MDFLENSSGSEDFFSANSSVSLDDSNKENEDPLSPRTCRRGKKKNRKILKLSTAPSPDSEGRSYWNHETRIGRLEAEQRKMKEELAALFAQKTSDGSSNMFEDFTDRRFWLLKAYKLSGISLTPASLKALVEELALVDELPGDSDNYMTSDMIDEARRMSQSPTAFSWQLAQRVFTLKELFESKQKKTPLCSIRLKAIKDAVVSSFPDMDWEKCRKDGINNGIRYLFGRKKLKNSRFLWLKIWDL